MLLSLLDVCTKEELEEEGPTYIEETAEETAKRERAIKNKILAIGLVSRVI